MSEDNYNKPPKFFTQFLEKFPEIGQKYQEIGDAVHQHGPLTARERALVKLAISGSNQMESAYKSHIRKATSVGLSREDIEHVALLSLPTKGFPSMMAQLGIIESQYKKQ